MTLIRQRPTCRCCGLPAVRGRWGKRRRAAYGGRKGLALPSEFPVWLCRQSRALCLTQDVLAALQAAHRESVRQSVVKSLDELTRWCSGRKLETRLGVSQGYFSRLRHGKGQPSTVLAILLELLARDPTRLSELDEHWG